MRYWYDSLFPSVVFESEGGCSERLLSMCMDRFLPLSEVTVTAYGFRAHIPAWKYRCLHKPARAAGCKLHVLHKKGVWFRIRPLRRHSGLAVGVLLALLLLASGRFLVWNIEYRGVDAADRQALADRLFACGVYQGAWVEDTMLRQAEDAIMTQTQDYSAVALNFTKGKLTVEVNPATKRPVMHLPQERDILALETGVIRSVEVYAGTSDVQPGQLVQKGDILVRSTWPDQENKLQPSPCRARIMAYLEKSYTTVCERSFQYEVVTGTKTDSVALCLGGRRFLLKKGEDSTANPSQRGLSVLGFSLPVTVWKKTAVQKRTETAVLSEEQAKKRCEQTLDALIYGELQSVEILSRDYVYEVTPERVVCTVNVRAYADIAAENIQTP